MQNCKHPKLNDQKTVTNDVRTRWATIQLKSGKCESVSAAYE